MRDGYQQYVKHGSREKRNLHMRIANLIQQNIPLLSAKTACTDSRLGLTEYFVLEILTRAMDRRWHAVLRQRANMVHGRSKEGKNQATYS